MSTILAVALGVALAVALAGLVLAYLSARSQGSSGRIRRPAVLRKRGSHLEEELREAQDEIRRTRHLATLSETFDLEELLARVLQASAALADADAAAVALWQEGGPPVVKSMNLPPEEAHSVLGPGGASQGCDHPLPVRRSGGVPKVRGGPVQRAPAACERSRAAAWGVGRVLAARRRGAGRGPDCGARRPGGSRRTSDRERAQIQRAARARGPRSAERPLQPPLFSRDAGTRGEPRPQARPADGIDLLRPRRLQGDQRAGWPSRR